MFKDPGPNNHTLNGALGPESLNIAYFDPLGKFSGLPVWREVRCPQDARARARASATRAKPKADRSNKKACGKWSLLRNCFTIVYP